MASEEDAEPIVARIERARTASRPRALRILTLLSLPGSLHGRVARWLLGVWVGSESGYGARRGVVAAMLAAPEGVVRELEGQAAALLRAGHPVTASRLRDLFLVVELLRPTLAPSTAGILD